MNRQTSPTPVKEPSPEGLAAVQRVVDVVGASARLVTNLLGNVERLVSDLVGDSAAVARESEQLYAAAAAAAQSVSTAVKATPRFWRVVQEVVRLAAAYRIHEIKARALSSAAAERALQQLHQRSADRLYDLCVELRGGVLKVGQFVSSRVDLLPAPYVASLSRLQDQVPPIPVEQIAGRIEEELGAALDRLFVDFDPEPLAAASLAQVHGAVIESETGPVRVAVKVQVPEIERTVEVDLAALKVIATVLEDLLPHLDLRTIAAELEPSILRELDYHWEAEAAGELARMFEAEPRVCVPQIYPALSSGRVLTMERIDGERLVQFFDGCEASGATTALDRLFETLLRTTCAQVLQHGLFQADPHPGNFLVVPGDEGPELALLDFGAVTRFPDALRRAYAELAGAILARDQQQVVERLTTLGFSTRTGDETALLRFAEMVMDSFRPDPGVSLAELDPRALFEEALVLARANPVHVPQDFVLLGRVFAALGGLLLRYRPRLNLFALLAPYLATASTRPAVQPQLEN
jgi:ubiquinone biosynthesis protein